MSAELSPSLNLLRPSGQAPAPNLQKSAPQKGSSAFQQSLSRAGEALSRERSAAERNQQDDAERSAPSKSAEAKATQAAEESHESATSSAETNPSNTQRRLQDEGREFGSEEAVADDRRWSVESTEAVAQPQSDESDLADDNITHLSAVVVPGEASSAAISGAIVISPAATETPTVAAPVQADTQGAASGTAQALLGEVGHRRFGLSAGNKSDAAPALDKPVILRIGPASESASTQPRQVAATALPGGATVSENKVLIAGTPLSSVLEGEQSGLDIPSLWQAKPDALKVDNSATGQASTIAGDVSMRGARNEALTPASLTLNAMGQDEGLLEPGSKSNRSSEFIQALTEAQKTVAASTSAGSGSAQSPQAQTHSLLPGGASPTRPTVPVTVTFGQELWGQQVAERTAMMVGQQIQSAELQLDPPELGPLNVRIQVHNDQASVQFTSANVQVRDALDQSLVKLRDLLQEQGLELVDSGVSDHAPDQQGEHTEGEGAWAGGSAGQESADDSPSSTVLTSQWQLDSGIDDFA